MYGNNREYQRGEHINCTAKISEDGKTYTSVRVNDISSSGLAIFSTEKYHVGNKIFIELIIDGFFSQFLVITEGKIVRCTAVAHEFLYGIKFVGLGEDMRIRLDMNIVRGSIVDSGSDSYERD